jgi:hypothetical protein
MPTADLYWVARQQQASLVSWYVITRSVAPMLVCASKADWEEVERHSECLPSGFLDEMILNFLNKNHPNFCLNEIARDRHKIEVELATGLEIVFNKSGEFLRYDD